MTRRLLSACVLAALAALGGVAQGHGGLPVSQRILRQGNGDTLYVPVVFWGVWVGAPGQPWRWICEEEINLNRARRMALSTDGTFYTTDVRGLEVSTDQGCTWKPVATGELPGRKLTDVAADPIDGATAWVTSGDSGGTDGDGAVGTPSNALFVTHDHGATWTRSPGLAAQSSRAFASVKLAADGQNLYVTSTAPEAPFAPMVHRSSDAGAHASSLPFTNTVDGVTPYSLEVMAIDPRSAGVVYVRAFAAVATDGGSVGRQVLYRSIDGGATFSELTRLDAVVAPSGQSRGIDDVAIDAARGRVLVATANGLLGGSDPGGAATVTLTKTSSLSQAQCVDVHGGAVFACGTNYAPDFMALGRSDDGALTFQKALAYVDTLGPVNCPSGTPVGDNCPAYWQMYGQQLGITFDDAGAPVDGGKPPPSGGGCAYPIGAGGGASAGLLAAILVFVAVSRRRGGRDRR